MRRKDSTEATVSKVKVELNAKLDALKPIEPKDVVDYDTDHLDTHKKLEDVEEILQVFLKLNEYKGGLKKFLQGMHYEELTREDGSKVYLKDGRLVNDILEDIIVTKYNGKYAYVKKGDLKLYGQVAVRPYKTTVVTKYGDFQAPVMVVGGQPVYIKWKDLLTNDEKEAYELYNNKGEEYDAMELEKKIMQDLIRYTQLGTRTIDEIKGIADKIKNELEAVGTITSCEFKDGKFTMKFGWRMGTDNSQEYEPKVLPPLTIKIDFRNREIHMDGYHPHNIHGDPCLGGTLTRLRDECFKSKDIYGLVMGMVQFGNSFTSEDCGGSDRDPANQLRYQLGNMSLESIQAINTVSFLEIYKTIAGYDACWFIYNSITSEWFKKQCEDKEFLYQLIRGVSDEQASHLLGGLGVEEEERAGIIKEARGN